jgi:hypothetical protein
MATKVANKPGPSVLFSVIVITISRIIGGQADEERGRKNVSFLGRKFRTFVGPLDEYGYCFGGGQQSYLRKREGHVSIINSLPTKTDRFRADPNACP